MPARTAVLPGTSPSRPLEFIVSHLKPPAGSGATGPVTGVSVAAVVGFLVFLELTSGVLQGLMPVLLPEIGADLRVDAGDLNWVSSLQLLSAAVSVPVFGRLGDMYGHRRLLRVAVVSLAIGSVLVAWSPSFGVLLLGRVLQGPLAALLPLEIGIVRDRLDAQGAKSAIGMLVGSLTFGASAGLIVAGLLGKWISNVHGVLWIPAVVTILCVPVAFFLVPESRTRAGGTVDWIGAAMLSVGLSALLLAIARGPKWGWTSGPVYALFALGAVVLVAWVFVELRVDHPIVDIRLSARRNLLPVYVASFFLGAALFGSQTAASLFLSSPREKVGYGFGYDTLGIGWMMLPSGVFAFAAATVVARLAKALGGRVVLGLGGAAMTVGYVFLTLGHGAPWQFLVANSVIGLGTGLALGALPGLVLDASPADRTGIATGVYNTTKTLGGSVAGAVFAALLTSLTIGHSKVPTEHAYVAVWWCCAGVSVLIAVFAMLVRGPRTEVAVPRVGAVSAAA
ncbi:MFS transporter [Embleya sp. AB8]|uniref:MFS transporter n=1 Tax=Embleya sp. AB8 TaxID=3156304 RepID=UPI003C773A25